MIKKILLAAAVLAAVLTAVTVSCESDDEPFSVGASVQHNGWTWTYDENGDVISLSGSGTEIALSDWPSAVVSMRYNYAGSLNCPNLTALSIPGSVKKLGDMAFYGCSTLTTVTIYAGLEEIGSKAFAETGITKIVIPSTVTLVNPAAFASCPNLTSLTVSSTNTAYKATSSILYSIDGTHLVCAASGKTGTITVPNTVTSIEQSAFYGCSKVTRISLPSGLAEIPAYAFYDCTSLKTVSIPSSVEAIGNGAFNGCSSLTSVQLPWSLSKINRDTFKGCSSLQSVYIPDAVTVIDQGAFRDCISLPPMMFSEHVTNISSAAFAGCTLMDYAVVADTTAVAADAFPETTQILPYIEYTSYPTADMVIRHVSPYTYELSTSAVGRAVWSISGKTLEGSSVRHNFNSGGEYKISLSIYDEAGTKTHAAERVLTVTEENTDTEKSEYHPFLIISAAAAVLSAACSIIIPASRRVMIFIFTASVLAAVCALILEAVL